MASIPNLIDAFIDGRLDEYWTHRALIGGSIVAEVSVAAGILLESHWPRSLKDWAAVLLIICGVSFGAIFTIGLFVFDEGISRIQQSTIEVQQSKIIALESAFAPREVELSGDAMKALAKFSSEFQYLVISAPGLEAEQTAGQIRSLLAGAEWKEYLGPMPSYGPAIFQEGIRAKFMGAYISDVSRITQETSAAEQRSKDAGIVTEILERAGRFAIELGPGGAASTSMQNLFLIAVGPKPFPEVLKRGFSPPNGPEKICCAIKQSERPDFSMPQLAR